MTLVHNLLRRLLLALVRLFYPVIQTTGLERLSGLQDRPVLFVVNHPNALIDPLLVQLALGKRVRFLGKSTLFRNPISRVAMESFGAIPVYRARDAGEGADTSRNEETFATCRDVLRSGGTIALFPEGTSHSDAAMKPLKTGAARIALSTAFEDNAQCPLVVVPVGLTYENKATFRSRVLVRVGNPIPIAQYEDAYRSEARAAVEALTRTIREGLDEVVFQAESRALIDGLVHIASATSERAEIRNDLAAIDERARVLADGYQRLAQHDPQRLQEITGHAQRYLRTLRRLGVSDPWLLETGRLSLRTRVVYVLKLLALLPFACVGSVLGWIPYRATGLLVKRVAGTHDVVSTMKLLGGVMILGSTWMLESLGAALIWNWRVGLLIAIAAPLCGLAALVFDEMLEAAWEYVRSSWVRVYAGDTAAALHARRVALAREIEEALTRASLTTPREDPQ